jgi:hypothetical protein
LPAIELGAMANDSVSIRAIFVQELHDEISSTLSARVSSYVSQPDGCNAISNGNRCI